MEKIKFERGTGNPTDLKGKGPGKKVKTAKAKKKSIDDAYLEALAALPEELADSKFLAQYIQAQMATRRKRTLDKLEEQTAEAIIGKFKAIEEGEKEYIGQYSTKHFSYTIWQLPNGRYFREVVAKTGLRIALKTE